MLLVALALFKHMQVGGIRKHKCHVYTRSVSGGTERERVGNTKGSQTLEGSGVYVKGLARVQTLVMLAYKNNH